MVICLICNKEYKSYHALSAHIKRSHNISLENYYINFINSKHNCEVCGKPTTFISLSKGFHNCCSSDCSYKSNSRKEKLKQTFKDTDKLNNMIAKQKESYPTHTKENIEKFKTTRNNNLTSHYAHRAAQVNSTYISKDNKRLFFKCNICQSNYSYSRTGFNNLLRRNITKICPVCFPNTKTSRAEKELFDFIKSIHGNIIPNEHTILNGKELDIYLPDLKIAFEYNGLYWHNDKLDKPSLLWKTEECEKQGIKLYHIFEDEWLYDMAVTKQKIQTIFSDLKTFNIILDRRYNSILDYADYNITILPPKTWYFTDQRRTEYQTENYITDCGYFIANYK